MNDVFGHAYYLICRDLAMNGETSFSELKTLGFTDGNLHTKMRLLETKGYVKVKRAFVDKTPRTSYSLTKRGASEFSSFVDLIAKDMIENKGKQET